MLSCNGPELNWVYGTALKEATIRPRTSCRLKSRADPGTKASGHMSEGIVVCPGQKDPG